MGVGRLTCVDKRVGVIKCGRNFMVVLGATKPRNLFIHENFSPYSIYMSTICISQSTITIVHSYITVYYHYCTFVYHSLLSLLYICISQSRLSTSSVHTSDCIQWIHRHSLLPSVATTLFISSKLLIRELTQSKYGSRYSSAYMACKRKGREKWFHHTSTIDMYHTPDCPPATYPLEATIVRVLQDSGLGGNWL